MGRRSFNLGRVRSLEIAKVLRLRHRLATVVAFCLVALLALDFSARAGDGEGTTRPELVERLEWHAERFRGNTHAIKTDAGLMGFHFDTTLVGALRTLADNTSRPNYLHPDAARASHKVKLTAAGTQEELILAVAEHVGLAASVHPTGFVVADERRVAKPEWIDQAVVLSRVPNRRVRLAIELEVDGQAIPTPVDLIIGRSNWTGFEAGGCRINLVARRIDDEGVEIELRSHLGSVGQVWHLNKQVPYGQQRVLIDGGVWGTDGELRQVVLRASADEVDWGSEPNLSDSESP